MKAVWAVVTAVALVGGVVWAGLAADAPSSKIRPGSPVVNLGRVYPKNDNGGIGTFNKGIPLPGGRTPNVIPEPGRP
jgi:hypothetical protein